MADPIQTPQTPRMQALRNLAKNLPVANSAVAQGQQAARQMQLQQAVQAAPPSIKTTQAAQTIGQQQAAGAGKQMVESASAATAPKGALAQIGNQAVQEQQQQSSAKTAGLAAGSKEQQMDNVEKFAALSESAKKELYDKQMKFDKDENGRTLFNAEQLADWTKLKARNSEEYKNYAQSATQISKRNIQAIEHAYALIEEDLNQQYRVAEEKNDRKAAEEIRRMKKDAADRLEREKTRYNNSVGAWQAGGTIVGTAVGAYFGGAAGAKIGGQVGGQGGTAIGQGQAKSPGEEQMANTFTDALKANAAESEDSAGLSATINKPTPAVINPKTGKYDEKDLGSNIPSKDAIANLQHVIDSHKGVAPPDATSQFQKAIDEAKRAYQQKADAAEWGEVAQNLGAAIVRFGAAQYSMGHEGSTGMDSTRVSNYGPGIDFGKKGDRAFQEYQQSITNALNSSKMTREQWDDAEKQRKEDLSTAMTPAQDLIKGAQAQEDDRRRHNDEMDRLAAQERINRAKEGRDNRKTKEDEDKFARKHQLDQDEKEFASLSTQIVKGKALLATAVNEGELPSKLDDKRKALYEKQAAEAGISLFDLDNAVKKAQEDKKYLKEGSGYFGSDVGRETDKAKITIDLENDLFKDHRKRLGELKNHIDELSGRKSPGAAPAAGGGKIRVRNTSTGQTGTLDAKDFDSTKYEKL